MKDKSGELADDAVEAVKARPVVSGAALGAVLLFLRDVLRPRLVVSRRDAAQQHERESDEAHRVT